MGRNSCSLLLACRFEACVGCGDIPRADIGIFRQTGRYGNEKALTKEAETRDIARDLIVLVTSAWQNRLPGEWGIVYFALPLDPEDYSAPPAVTLKAW
jgi:hypothetical protein